MERNPEKSILSRSILAALFSGLMAICATLLYNIAYRVITRYNPSYIINISSIIFGTLIACMFAGVIFYFFKKYIRGGVYLFRLVFLALCIALAVAAFRSHYGGNLPPFQGFPGLVLGVDIILGTSIILFIPYFFKNDKIYLD